MGRDAIAQRGGTHGWCSVSKLTEVQYGSSAGIWRSSESLKMPFLKTSFESLAPILALSTDYHVRKDRGQEKLQSRCGEGRLIDACNTRESGQLDMKKWLSVGYA